MRRVGYQANFAGAVESVASQGGQILPPIMGASAFIIAEYTGTPLIRVMLYALVPALIYFLVAGLMVYFQAVKQELKGVPREELPDCKEILYTRGHLFLPIILIIVILVMGFSPLRAGFIGLISIIVLAMLKKDTRLSIIDFLSALERGVRDTLVVATACACAGIIVGSIVQTGLGIRFSRFAIEMGGEILFLVLLFMMVASIILGMGMTTVSVYLILSVLGAPALMDLGVFEIGAHLYVFYFGIMSGLTPPVALAAYTAAGIARGDPQKTSFIAFRLGLGGFIVPFMFVYNEALLLQGSPLNIVIGVITALIGCIAFASAIQGYMLIDVILWQRAVLLVSAILMIGFVGPLTLLGMVLFIIIIILNNNDRKTKRLLAHGDGGSA